MQLPLQEGVQLSAAEYRRRLYQVLGPATPGDPHPRALGASRAGAPAPRAALSRPPLCR